MTRKIKAGTQPTPAIPAIPPTDVLGRLAALATMATPDLKQQWRDLFGTEPPPYNQKFLRNLLAYRVQELAYGGLKPTTIARLEALGEQLDGGNITHPPHPGGHEADRRHDLGAGIPGRRAPGDGAG